MKVPNQSDRWKHSKQIFKHLPSVLFWVVLFLLFLWVLLQLPSPFCCQVLDQLFQLRIHLRISGCHAVGIIAVGSDRTAWDGVIFLGFDKHWKAGMHLRSPEYMCLSFNNSGISFLNTTNSIEMKIVNLHTNTSLRSTTTPHQGLLNQHLSRDMRMP